MILKTEIYMLVYVYTSPHSSTPVGVRKYIYICLYTYMYVYSYVFGVCICMLGVSGPLCVYICLIHSQQPYELGLSFFYCYEKINC